MQVLSMVFEDLMELGEIMVISSQFGSFVAHSIFGFMLMMLCLKQQLEKKSS